MLSRFTRLPLGRCLHTAAPRVAPSRLRYTLGASAAVAATYITWQLTSDSNRIALDSATKVHPVQQSSSSSPPPSSTNLGRETPFVTDPVHTESATEIPHEDKPSDAAALGKATEDPEREAEGGESPDAGTGGAFNPVTGEINWDCPCLGGMAHGPCGPEFREAFSCFVFSEEEPKGINCVEKFKGMQTCFREHPEIYGDEIMDDEEDEQPAAVPEGAVLTSSEDTIPTKQGDTASEDVPSSLPAEPAVQKKPAFKDEPSPASALS